MNLKLDNILRNNYDRLIDNDMISDLRLHSGALLSLVCPWFKCYVNMSWKWTHFCH